MGRIVRGEADDEGDWLGIVIHGPGGMDAYERHGLARFEDERVDAGRWVLRCLADLACEGAEDILASLMARRSAQLARGLRP